MLVRLLAAASAAARAVAVTPVAVAAPVAAAAAAVVFAFVNAHSARASVPRGARCRRLLGCLASVARRHGLLKPLRPLVSSAR